MNEWVLRNTPVVKRMAVSSRKITRRITKEKLANVRDTWWRDSGQCLTIILEISVGIDDRLTNIELR